jgi:hypothetical protein
VPVLVSKRGGPGQLLTPLLPVAALHFLHLASLAQHRWLVTRLGTLHLQAAARFVLRLLTQLIAAAYAPVTQHRLLPSSAFRARQPSVAVPVLVSKRGGPGQLLTPPLPVAALHFLHLASLAQHRWLVMRLGTLHLQSRARPDPAPAPPFACGQTNLRVWNPSQVETF